MIKKDSSINVKDLTANRIWLWRWLPALVWLIISAGTLVLWKALADQDLKTNSLSISYFD